MSAPPPIFSVIVVCKNPGLRLQTALGSLWEQQETALEIIVIDGASTDGTRDWLEAQRARLGALVSEPDSGVYAAMNKGLARARGEWVLFLGADDRLASPSILAETRASLRDSGAGVAVGEVKYDDGRVYRLAPRVNAIARNFAHHQGAFYRRELFAENGGFDPTLTIMGDYDFNLRLWKNRVRFQPLSRPIATCGTHGLSDAGAWRGYAEEIHVRHRHFPVWRAVFWDTLSLLRYLRKRAVRCFLARPSPS